MATTPETAHDDRNRRQNLLAVFWDAALGFWRRGAGPTAWALSVGLVVLAFVNLAIQYRLNVWHRAMFDALDGKDASRVLFQSMIFIPLTFANVALATGTVWTRMTTERNWRAWLNGHLLDRWISSGRYYQLDLIKGDHRNPEHRVAEDLRVACEAPVDFAAGILSAFLTAITFIGVLWFIGGSLTIPVGGSTITVPGFLVIAAIGVASPLVSLGRLERADREESTGRITRQETPGAALRLRGLAVTLDDGNAVVNEADVEIAPGEKVLVVGESGTGKSTLVRAISGLWPWGEGEIQTQPDAKLFLMPKQSYVPLGTLRRAATYPLSLERLPDATVVSVGHRARSSRRTIPASSCWSTTRRGRGSHATNPSRARSGARPASWRDSSVGRARVLSRDVRGPPVLRPRVMIDFGLSEEQEALQQSAREFLAHECPPALVRETAKSDNGVPHELYRRMAGLGWMGLIVPEQDGGLGLGALELVLVLEELGRVAAPGPFLTTQLVIAALLRGGTAAQRADWLPRFLGGEAFATLAHLEESDRHTPDGIQMKARKMRDGFVLSGAKLFVPEAPGADVFLVAARTKAGAGPAGVSLFLVDRNSKGVRVKAQQHVDVTRRFGELLLKDVLVPRAALVGAEGQGWPLLARLLDLAAIGIAADSLGGAQRTLEMAVEYSKVREQFGRKIGSFQSLKHIAAEMVADVEPARSLVWYAAYAYDRRPRDAARAAAMAKASLGDVYSRTARRSVEMHGGIGFTWEFDLQLWFKRAHVNEAAYGAPAYHRERVAQLDGY